MKTLYFTEECQLRPTDKSWNSYTRQDLMIGIKTSGEELMGNWRLHNDKVTPHRLFLGQKEKTHHGGCQCPNTVVNLNLPMMGKPVHKIT